MNGKLIIIDGPKAAGKDTQAELLRNKLEENGHKVLFGLYEPGSVSIKAEILRFILKNQLNTEYRFPGDFAKTFDFEKYQKEILSEVLPSVAKEYLESAINDLSDAYRAKRTILQFLVENKRIFNSKLCPVFSRKPKIETLQDILKREKLPPSAQAQICFATRNIVYTRIEDLLKHNYDFIILNRSAESTTVYQGYAQDPSKISQIRLENYKATNHIRPFITYLIDIPSEISVQRFEESGSENDFFQNKIYEDPDFFQKIRDGYIEEAKYFQNIKNSHFLKKDIVLIDGTTGSEFGKEESMRMVHETIYGLLMDKINQQK
jgi:thymidylate kinase